MFKGIDMSVFQGVPNFALVAKTQQFCYIKVTDGEKYKYQIAKAQATGAQLNGLKVGYYHFGHPEDTNTTAKAEAEFFVQNITALGLPAADLIPAIDVEQVYAGAEVPVPVGRLYTWLKEFIGRMSELGFPRVMIYSNPAYLNHYLPANHDLGMYPLWLSEYAQSITIKANGWPSVSLWQNSEKGQIPGIIGNVDLNICEDLSLITFSPAA